MVLGVHRIRSKADVVLGEVDDREETRILRCCIFISTFANPVLLFHKVGCGLTVNGLAPENVDVRIGNLFESVVGMQAW